MKINTKYLYELLPAYYRVIDEEQGRPLEAFISLLAREGAIVEENISQLYENWFIETCEEWVVPYIGDLLGVKSIHEIEDATVYSRRAYIANTLSYRRRKGTAPILEQIAFDITGWQSKVVEFFQLLSTAQNLNHVRLHNTVTPDMRQMDALDLVNSAFDLQSHTIDVRRIETGQGLYNIMNIGIYLWRLQSYPLGDSYNPDPLADNANNSYLDARKMEFETGMPEERYTFSPLGLDTHLFNRPQAERDIVHLAEEINVPGLLRRRALHDELENARRALVNGESPSFLYFHNTSYAPTFQIFINNSPIPIPREEITICNLSTWRPAPVTKNYDKYEQDGSISTIPKAITVAVDPVLGRITFPDGVLSTGSEVLLNYSYGFSGDLGGGPYDRRSSLLALEALTFDWHVGVSIDHTSVQGETIHSTLQNAIDDWHSGPAKQLGLITIMDSRTYTKGIMDSWEIQIAEGQRLFIIAADWPEKENSLGVKHRVPGTFNAEDLRPHLLGDLVIDGITPTGASSGGGLYVNGLLIEGKITVVDGSLNSCQIDHCTLVPDNEGIIVEPQLSILNLSLYRSISGAVNVVAEDASVTIEESIIDHKSGTAISVPNGQLAIQKTSVYGLVESQSLDASNSIFMDELNIERRQIGCVRFSYLPDGSKTPRRYRCQPELEIQTQIKDVEEQAQLNGVLLSPLEKQTIKDQILDWLFPVFNASTYGHHAYAQLDDATPQQITKGGDNGSEMGAFNYLQQPQREANLKIVLEEYLRLGLEAGIIYAT